jgi:hypothetical protein
MNVARNVQVGAMSLAVTGPAIQANDATTAGRMRFMIASSLGPAGGHGNLAAAS